MPGPFPGMDPYMESPALWESVHQALVTYTAAALNAALPRGYVAVPEQWLYVVPPSRIKPDVSVGVTPPPPPRQGGVAILEPPRAEANAPWIVEDVEEQVRQPYVTVVRASDRSEVLAAIEFLSHANKTPGKDHDAYRRKQRKILDSGTHLIEIDLLRAGAHTIASPLERLPGEDYDFFVCLHRSRTGRRFELWPSRVRERLPCVSVPLDAGTPDVPLDLQPVLDRWYDEGAYRYQLDYSKEPDPPLSAEDAAWADALLREKGLRP